MEDDVTGQPLPRRNVIWREGDRVEIHGATSWNGCRGRIATQYPSSQLDPSWVAVAIDDQDGVFVFKDHELTRIGAAEPSRKSVWSRIKLAWAVLRGQQTWPDGYPTPWAYDAAAALQRRHEQLRALATDERLVEELWHAGRRDDIRRALAKRTAT